MKLDLSKNIDVKKAETYLEKLKSKKAKIELKEFRAKRSIDQNSYLHVCVQMICDFTGYTVEEQKVELKRRFGSFMIYEKNGTRFLTSTKDL